MDLQLAGKRALVTGATGGIGEAAAVMLAQEGAVVAVNGRAPDKVDRVVDAISAAGGVAVAALGDMESEAGMEAAAAAVEQALGGVDVLVNNLGGSVFKGVRTWFDAPAEDYLRTYRRNVTSAVALTNRFQQGMRDAGWGRIINLSSVAAFQPSGALPEYEGAKAAILAITKGLSKALANTGVTANAVVPGVILTEAVRVWITAHAEKLGWEGEFDELQARFAREVQPIPAGSFAAPEAVAYVITMLASPRAGYITGANIRVDGGTVVGLL